MKTVYLIRHSKPFKCINEYNDDSLQIQNEKYSLSVEGEQIAKDKFSSIEFRNINKVYASNYVRAIETAKYIANKNNLDVVVDSRLHERKIGISSWDELPNDFEKKQFLDNEYKIGNGENLKEVRNRMLLSIMNIVSNNTGRIAIVSHANAITSLLKEWCDITYSDDILIYNYKGKELLRGYIHYCDTFKLEFDDNNNLIDINYIGD